MLVLSPKNALHSQKNIELTLDSAIEIAISNSYQVRQLQLSIERTREWLKAERAELRSRVYMTLEAPEFEAISDYKWNSTLQRNEIVRENTRLWQMNFSVEQPVILFGYPTNGYLSLNNRMYRYNQRNGGDDINYYNRYYIEYEQPLFQPNRLKNDIEEAEIDLEKEEIEFVEDLVDMLEDLSEDYYELLGLTFEREKFNDQIILLEQSRQIAAEIVARDSSRIIELNQIEIELANMEERRSDIQSSIRIETSEMKQDLRLAEEDSVFIVPTIIIDTIEVSREDALQKALALHPSIRDNELSRREEEIELENTIGNDAFHIDLEMTYGLEKSDPSYRNLWESQDNSYTVSVRAFIPIWDWGERKAEIQARKITLKKRDLYIEEERREIESEVQTDIINLREFQARAVRMQSNLRKAREISNVSLEQYSADLIGLQELFQNFERQEETADNLFDAYLGYRFALLSLLEDTYYDFERNMPLVQRFPLANFSEN
jgi:outer membrane protein TolC